MALKYNWGICVNNDKDDSGNPCSLCASKEKQKVIVNREFVCAECGEPLKKVAPPKTIFEKYGMGIIGGVIALAAIGGGTAYYLSSSEERPIPTKLEIADYDPALWVGTTDTLTVKSTPADAKATYIWSSSNESVATVMNGILKVVGEGETTITVKVEGNEEISASATFYAENYKEVPVDEQPKGKGKKEDPEPTPTPVSNKINLGFAIYQGDVKNGKPEGNGIMTFKSQHIIPGSKGDVVAEPGEYVVGTWRNGEVNLVTLHQKNGNKPIITHK